MNTSIQSVAIAIFRLYEERRKELEKYSTRDLADLQHEAGELRLMAKEFTIRTSAEIIFTACTLILEERAEVRPPLQP